MIVDVPLRTVVCTQRRPYLVGCFTNSDDSPVFDIKFDLVMDPLYHNVEYIAGVFMIPMGFYTKKKMDSLEVVVSIFCCKKI